VGKHTSSDREAIPEVYLLCGPAGSGKTTFAEALADQGVAKLSIDESMSEQHGEAGVDYPVEDYPRREQGVLAENRERLVGFLAAGQSVVMDYGFWRREERAEYKDFVEAHGGRWRLIYFRANLETLWERVRARNLDIRASAPYISRGLLEDLVARFEEPVGEGEEIMELGAGNNSVG
jgi:predicted kinase